MTKELRLSFDDAEFKKIKKVKEINEMGWKEFIIMLIEKSRKENLARSKKL